MKTKLFTLITILLTVIVVAQIPKGYVANYNFNNDLINNVDGGSFSSTGVSPSYVSARNNSANQALNVAGDYVYNGYVFDKNTTSITSSFWLKTATSGETMLKAFNTTTRNGFIIDSFLNANTPYLRIRVESGGENSIYSVPLPDVFDDNWYNITLVVDHTLDYANLSVFRDVTVYINGTINQTLSSQLDATHTQTNNPYFFDLNKTASLEIGSNNSEYTGEIDDLYIYESALTTSEVSALVNNSSRNTAKTIYVNQNASGNNDGSSWIDAYTQLHSALRSTIDDDSIWIAEGTYTPNSVNGMVHYDVLSNNLKIYGGFSGTETNISERVFDQNKTIISGDLYGNDVTLTSFAQMTDIGTPLQENSERLFDITSTANNTLLDGLTFTKVCNYNPTVNSAGGAIVKDASVSGLTINNCTFEDNVSGSANAVLFADFNLNNSVSTPGSLVITDSKFINNMSAYATGIYALSRNDTFVDFTLSNCLFVKNQSTDRQSVVYPFTGITGSAMWLRNLSSTTGIFNANINNCTFADNIDKGTNVGANGGGKSVISLSQTLASTTLDVNITNTIFYGNSDGPGTVSKAINRIFDVNEPSNLTIQSSLDEDGFSELSPTTSNIITGNPLFNDVSNNDYNLSTGSVAIDAGDNTVVANGLADLNNKQRIFNTTVDLGAYEFNSIALSLTDESILSEVQVYPNPVSSTLKVNITSGEALKNVQVFTLLGEKILEGNNTTINFSTISKGIYLLKIESENGKIAVRKIIKE